MINNAFVVTFSTALVCVALCGHFGPATESFGENVVMGLFGLTGLVVGWISVWRGEA